MVVSDPKHLRKRIERRGIDIAKLEEPIRQLRKALKNATVRKEFGRADWYLEVKSKGETYCWIVGRGVNMCSVLEANMTPYGRNIAQAVR